jgi:predicted glycogen debranching enzyme
MSEFKTPSFEEAATREWIVTNGIGGYSSSTVCGLNTRRYHGILVASLNPPTERKVLVSKIEEEIHTPAATFKISTNQYPDNIHPEGFRHLRSFTRNPLPGMLFKSGDTQLLKTIFMVYNSNTTVVEYSNTGTEKFRLCLNPLYAGRDYHALLRESDEHVFKLTKHPTHQVIESGTMPRIYLKHPTVTFREEKNWHRNMEYKIEKERGQDHIEDVISSGHFELTLAPGQSASLIFTLDERMLTEPPEKLKQDEINRISNLVPKDVKDQFLADLLVCGDQFVVSRKSTANYSIIAGYHWFTDWGRDSMIALRGLCIATGRKEQAASVILTFLNHLRDGLIPNRFPDWETDEPEYHTIDATLWLFVAVYDFDKKFNDTSFLAKISPQLRDILDHHIKGTKHSIHVLSNGLLSGGTPGLPLTWMDARIQNHCFTPRRGCPVEISALWFNALKIYEHICKRTGISIDPVFNEHIIKVKESFVNAFWNHNGYLNDTITPSFQIDASIRPNQVYALSLPFTLLSHDQEMKVLETIETTLLTDYGLRTLDPRHPHFKGSYDGNLWSRDEAYHQGTVWPFLLPEFITALLRLHNNSPEARQKASKMLQKLKAHFYNEECVNGISEIFDGTDPRHGKGCMNQAWSVSNVLLVMLNNNLAV